MRYIIYFLLSIICCAFTYNDSQATTPVVNSYEELAAYVKAKERLIVEKQLVVPNTRSFKNKNPMNIKCGASDWDGQIACRNKYCVFETYTHGLRAGYKLLLKYEKAYKINTLKKFAEKYCPENKDRYTKGLCKLMGLKANEKFSIKNRVFDLMKAIVFLENSVQPFGPEFFVHYE